MFHSDQVPIRCVYMRGGSSKGAFLLASDLPPDPVVRDRVLLAMYGSPDKRQIDGIGGADPLTSKVAIIARSQREDADVDYTFGQVGIDQPKVHYGGNCGNMLAGVGPFAVDEGLVPVVEPVTRVRIHNTNTGKVIAAEVPVEGGRAKVLGDCQIAGVPSSGARIMLDFMDCSGAMTGRLLPTGNLRDRLQVEGKVVEVSVVDAATTFIFVRAEDVGLRGTELPDEIEANASAMDRLEAIRGEVARWLGLVGPDDDPRQKSPNVPRIMAVAESQDYRSAAGAVVNKSEADLTVRQMAMQRPHKTLAVTGSICAAVAARLPGTVVHEVASVPDEGRVVRIAHPAGVMRVEVEMQHSAGTVRITRSAIERTARRIMEGIVYIPRTAVDGRIA